MMHINVTDAGSYEWNAQQISRNLHCFHHHHVIIIIIIIIIIIVVVVVVVVVVILYC